MTSSTTIDAKLAKTFESASAELTARIRAAISEFYAKPPHGWQAWEFRRTPKPWEERVLTNLENYHKELESALRAYQTGDVKPITLAAAGYAGLSKDMEFDMNWMTDANRLAIREAVTDLVLVADSIHRLGYAELAKAGRL